MARKSEKTVYRGDPSRDPRKCVTVHPEEGKRKSRELSLYSREVNHSPTGFGWGYGGSGPAQLAYAILRDFLGDKKQAMAVYQHFKFEVVAKLEQGVPWELTGERIAATSAVLSIVVREVMES